MNTDQKLIGWYLKEVDILISNQMNNTLAEKQINRFQWQLLTNIAKAGFIIFEDFY